MILQPLFLFCIPGKVLTIFSLFAIKHFPFVFILNLPADCASEFTTEKSSYDRKCDACLFFALTHVTSQQ